MTKIAIIGGGIVGATAAFYLHQNPSNDIQVYDEGTGQATKAAAGIISPWMSKRRNKRWYRLADLGANLYPELASDAQLSTSAYHQTGTLVTRQTDEDLQELYQLASKRLKSSPQMQSLEEWTPADVRSKLPFIDHDLTGIYVQGGARVDGFELVRELLEQAHVIPKIEHAIISNQAGTLSVNGEAFDVVIIATGAWLNDLLKPLGYTSTVRAQKGQLIELAVPHLEISGEMPVVMPEGERDLIPLAPHKLLIGATHEDELQFDLNLDERVLQADLLASGQHNISGIDWPMVSGMRVGTRAYTPDFAPFLGPLDGIPNLFVASGLGSSGLTTGPMIGKLLADSIDHGLTDYSSVSQPVNLYVKPD